MYVIPRYDPVFVEPNLKEYETQVSFKLFYIGKRCMNKYKITPKFHKYPRYIRAVSRMSYGHTCCGTIHNNVHENNNIIIFENC
jgi:hypothetical protein